MNELTQHDRLRILDKVSNLVQKKHVTLNATGVNWRDLVAARTHEIVDATSAADFEKAMQDLLGQLKTSHTGFRHHKSPNIAARLSIHATLRPVKINDSDVWMFEDVHPGGPAHASGIEPGFVLLGSRGKEITPPELPSFGPGEQVLLRVKKPDGADADITVQVPIPKSKVHPVTAPTTIICRKLAAHIGYIKVTMFPGRIGIDFARDLDAAVASLSDCNRLVIDLRGNTGGGIGSLRLMSYLTPDKRPIGYSLNRKLIDINYPKEKLRSFDRIPKHKAEIALLFLRFASTRGAVALRTEGLGQMPFHKRVVIITNRHTASSAEMVAAFAVENKLATLVGTKTAGRLLGGGGFKVGNGYILGLPTSAYFTWEGKLIEKNGIEPDVHVELDHEKLFAGHDTQLEKAVEIIQTL